MEKDKKWTVLLVIPALLAMIWLAFRIIAPYDNERVYYEALEKSYPSIAKIVEIKARPYTYTAHGRIFLSWRPRTDILSDRFILTPLCWTHPLRKPFPRR